jgi:AcrR family transcriptional regulator
MIHMDWRRYTAAIMGNREKLIAGALRCLQERGWARTTVRDIAAAAGVNHAAIGYHFGSKDALLAVALVEALDAWSRDAFNPTATPEDPVQDWRPVLEWMAEHRPALLANLDLLAQAQHSEELRGYVADVQEQSRRACAAWALGRAEQDVDEERVRGLGSVYVALTAGLAVQAIIDPDRIPTAAEAAAGLRDLAALYENTTDNSPR